MILGTDWFASSNWSPNLLLLVTNLSTGGLSSTHLHSNPRNHWSSMIRRPFFRLKTHDLDHFSQPFQVYAQKYHCLMIPNGIIWGWWWKFVPWYLFVPWRFRMVLLSQHCRMNFSLDSTQLFWNSLYCPAKLTRPSVYCLIRLDIFFHQ